MTSEPTHPTHARNAPDSAATHRVVVADDNRDSADSLGMMLSIMGYDVRTAYDGIAAVQLAESFRPQLMVLDVGMPRLNGYEAVRGIRERPWGRAVAIVAVTGWGQEGDRQRSQEAGCDGHLVKPVSLPVALTGWSEEEDRRRTAEAGFDRHWVKQVRPEDLEALRAGGGSGDPSR